MKKFKILILFFLSFLAIGGTAQIASNAGIGFNFTKLKTNGVDWVSESKIGYQAGISSTFGNYFYLEPGLYYIANYSDLIYVGNDNGITHGITYDYHTSYLRVPLLAGYHLAGNAENSFYDIRVFAGPTVSFLLSANEVGGLQKNEFNKVNWTLDAGVGFCVWIFYCNIGYDWGLSKVYSSEQAGNAKSEMFWMNVGARFRF